MMVKHNISLLVLILLVVMSGSVFAGITEKAMSERELFAADMISSDEDFLMEFIDLMPEDRLMEFYDKAILMAVEVASETEDIMNDDEAYIYISEKIDGAEGVKANVRKQVRTYLKRGDEVETRGRSVDVNYNLTVLLRDMFEYNYNQIHDNIAKVRLQKSVLN